MCRAQLRRLERTPSSSRLRLPAGSPHVGHDDRGDACRRLAVVGARHWHRHAQLWERERAPPANIRWEAATARVALDQFGKASSLFYWCLSVAGSRLTPIRCRRSLIPAGGSWGTPLTTLVQTETAATVSPLVATPAAPCVAVWVKTALLSKRHAGIGHSTFGSPLWCSGDSLELAVAAGKTAATWSTVSRPPSRPITTCHNHT